MATATYSLAGIPLFAAPDYTQGVGGFEVPEDLEVGLETWGSTHRLPQTGTTAPKMIAQTFGVFPIPISWEARWLGNQAESRSRTMAAAQQDQKVVPFLAGTRSWDVVIWSYKEKIRSRFDIAYFIEIRPLVDRSGHYSTGNASASAYQALQTQFSNLQAVGPQTLDPRALAAQTSLAAATVSIQAAQPETSASTATLSALAVTIANTASALSSVQASVVNSASPADVSLFLWATQALGYLQVYGATLSALSGSDGAVLRQVGPGSNLFTLAATELGDWTRFSDIGTLNGIVDPFIQVATSLVIPPATAGTH